ncbi:MAG: tetratricopeptide repeat protein [Polyangiales bacterium]
MRSSWSLRLALALVLTSGTVHAQAADPDALVREGVSLRRQQRDAEALAAFERAWAARPSPMVRAQVALAEQALGRWRAADAHLREALDASDPWVDRNRAMLTDALGAIDERLGALEVIGPPDGATLAIDGEAVATFPLNGPVRWPLGAAAVSIRCDGHAPAERQVTFERGVLVRETIALRPLPPPAPVAPVEPPAVLAPVVVAAPPVLPVTPRRARESSRGAGVGPWVLGGAGLGLGAVGLAVSLVLRDDALASLRAIGCAEGDGAVTCPRAAGDAARSFHARGEAASVGVDVSIAVGASALAGAALWWALGARRSTGARAVVCGGAWCAVTGSF